MWISGRLHVNFLLFGFNPFPNKPWFLRVSRCDMPILAHGLSPSIYTLDDTYHVKAEGPRRGDEGTLRLHPTV